MSCQYPIYGSPGQPPAYVKQMAPLPEPIDPRLVEQALRQMQYEQQPPMSQSDTVVVMNAPSDAPVVLTNYVDPYTDGVETFGASGLGRALGNPYQASAADESYNPMIRERTAEIMANALGYVDPNQVGVVFMQNQQPRRR